MVRAQCKLMFSFLFISDYAEIEGRQEEKSNMNSVLVVASLPCISSSSLTGY